MRLTALCVCGTLLVFSSLSWITADSNEGILLDLGHGFGPCTATLIPEEPCRQGQHESTCPYTLSLPPLTVQLPQQLRELERIVQDLEKLKDSVDQLRELCADCTVSNTERECGRQREHEEPNEDENERGWLNERVQESDRDYREEGETNRGKTENMEGDGDSGKGSTPEEKEAKSWEEERERDGVIKENKKDKSVSEVPKKDDKTKSVGTKQKDKLGQTKTYPAGGDIKLKETEKEKVADKNNRKIESDRHKQHATGESSKGKEEGKDEKGKEKKITTNLENTEKTQESEHLERQYETEETEKKTQTEASDRKKMSEDDGVHTNRKRGEHGEERKREMEKGPKVKQNNEKPKQTESIGHSEKEKTIKVWVVEEEGEKKKEEEEEEEEEDRETGEEIKPEGKKTESTQGNSDGGLSSSKAIERTDFVSVSPTPDSTIIKASRPDSSDSNEAVIFTSSLPSPPLPSSTSGLITNVSPETLTAYELTQSSGLGPAGVSEPPKTDADIVAATTSVSTLGGPGPQTTSTTANLIPASGVKPGAGVQSQISPTTTLGAPYQNFYVTAIPRTTESSRWATKKNISSNTRPGVKPLPGRGPKPETKPEADQELKNPKNDRKPERGHLPDKKPKNDQKRKLPHNKPTTNQKKPANIPKRVQNSNPDQISPPDVHSTDQNQKKRPKPDVERTPNQNKQPAKKPKLNQKIVTPVQRPPQRPQTVNTTRLDRRKNQTEEMPIIDEKRKPVYPVKTNRLDEKRKHEMKPDSQETKRSDQTFERNQEKSPVQEPEFGRNEMTIFTPKTDQDGGTESHKELVNPSLESLSNKDSTPVPPQESTLDQIVTKPGQRTKPYERSPTLNKKPVIDEIPSLKPTSNKQSTTGQEITPDAASLPPDRKLMPHQNIPTFNKKPVTEPMKKFDQEPTSNEGSTPEQKITADRGNTDRNQNFKPREKVQKINPKSVTESMEKSEQNPSIESESNPDSTPVENNTPGWGDTLSNQKLVPTQKMPTRNQQSITESIKKTNENPPVDPATIEDSTRGKKITPNQGNTKPKQTFLPNHKISSSNQQPLTESTRDSNKKPTIKPTNNRDLSPGQKVTPNQTNTEPSQKFEPSQGIPTKQQNPVTDSILDSFESVTEPDFTPVQKLTPDEDSTLDDRKLTTRQGIPIFNKELETKTTKNTDENTSPHTTTQVDSTPGHEIAPDQENTLPNQRFKPKKKIPAVSQTPVNKHMKKPEKTPTFKPQSNKDSTPRRKVTPTQDDTQPDQEVKPNQAIATINPRLESESREKSEGNLLQESTSNPDATPGQKNTPDQANSQPGQTVNANQGIHTINQKPETEYAEESAENPSSNKDSTPGQKISPDQGITSKDQQLKPHENIPKFNQEPVTELMKTFDKNVLFHPKSTTIPGENIIPERDNTRRDQKVQINQEIPTISSKPVTESVGKLDKNFTFKPHQDPTSNRKTTPERVNKRPEQRFNPNKEIPTMNPKPVGEEEADKNTSFQPKLHKDSKPGGRNRPDQAFTSPDQQLRPSQNMPTFDPQPVTESMEKSDPTSTKDSTPEQNIAPHWVDADHKTDGKTQTNQEIPLINTKPVTESVEKSDRNFPLKPTTHQDPTSGRKNTTPERVNKHPDQWFKSTEEIPTIIESREESDEKASTNKHSTPGQKMTPDQAVITPDQHLTTSQNISTFDQQPVTESMEKSDLTPGQNILPDQVDTRPDRKPQINTKPVMESVEKSDRNHTLKPSSHQEPTSGRKKTTPEKVNTRPAQKFKPNQKIPKTNQKPKPGHGLKPNQKLPKPATDLKTKPNVGRKTDQAPRTNQRLKTPKPNLNPKPLPDEVSRVESSKTSKKKPPPRNRLPIRTTIKPGATPDQKPKPAVHPEPSQRTKTHLDPPQISWTTSDGIQNSQSGVPPVSGPGKEIFEVTHSTRGPEFKPTMRETVTLDPKTANSLETGPLPHLHTPPEDFTVSLQSRTVSDLQPQTTSPPPSIPTTTQSNKIMHGTLPSVVSRTAPESTKPNPTLKSDSSSQAETLHNVDDAAPVIPLPPPTGRITSTPGPDFRSATSATSGLQPPAAESSTPSARELRVKINQVAAFLNNSLSTNGKQPARHPKQHPEDSGGGSRPEGMDTSTLIPPKVSSVMRDCSDHRIRGETRSGVYLVTPDLRSRSFRVFCDMEHAGGGWTVMQRRQDGSVSFNRTWTEYRDGFGELQGGEFWLGNNMMHLLTRERDMTLRVELEDFDGVDEYAHYEHFRVASERLRYRLTVGGYSGTAGDALRFNKRYDHNNRAFTTPDRDHDRYPSGNCGAYYSSGWWFDACMAANLNGRYYVGSYKGVRDGIFWGTWHNISSEYYPTNDRQSFKRVRMMIRPSGFAL